jgi:hypothetical protein
VGRRILAAGGLAGLLAVLTWTAPAPARADSVSERPEAVGVTLYRDRVTNTERYADPDEEATGLVLVTETRTIDVPAGLSKISFRGVADGMVPQTASIAGLPETVLERDHDYDLLTPGSLLDRSVGKTVTLVRTDPATGAVTEQRAIVRSGPDGVALEIDGKVEALKCSGLPERLVFDEMPAGLTDKPTLSIVTRAPTAGRYTITLSYLAVGMDWSTDYVARIRPDGKTLDLTAWVTLSNRSNTSYVDAPTSVVAGHLARDDGTVPPQVQAVGLKTGCWRRGTTHDRHRDRAVVRGNGGVQGVPIAVSGFGSDEVTEVVVTGSRLMERRELGDYKLYALPEPTTVAAHQSKQVAMLDQRGVPFERVYVYEDNLWQADGAQPGAYETIAPTVTLRLQNTEAGGLGKPLPGGGVSVMEPVAGRPEVLAGQTRIRDIPVGLPVELGVGGAMDVSVHPVLLSRTPDEQVGDRPRLWTVEVTLTNDKPIPVTVEYRLNLDPRDKLVRESRPHGMRGGRLQWVVRLTPGETVHLRYSVRATD